MTLVQTHPKPRRHVDKAYLAYIRKQPCCLCHARGPSIPHHVISRGAGGSDRHTVPVCWICHAKIHAGFGDKDELLQASKLLEVKHENKSD